MTDGPGTDVEEQAARLRAAVLALRQPQAAKRAPAPRSSVYGRAAAAVPADVRPPSDRALLQGRSRTVETSALLSGTSLVLVVLPDPGPAPAELLRSAQQCVSGGATAVLLGPELPRDVPPGRERPLCVPLRRDDPLAGEWAVLACGPARRVAFLARSAGQDRFEWLLTRDPVAVHRAGTAILDRVPFLRLRVPALSG